MSYEKLSNNLNFLISETRLNASELARRTGIPASSIKKIRNNDHPNPTLTTLIPLANFFAITISQLIGETPLNLEQAKTPSSQPQIPIISWSETATWPKLTDTPRAFAAADRIYQNAFGLIIEENLGEHFRKNSLLIIDSNAQPQSHDYVLTLKNPQTKPSIKQILIEDEHVFLKSLLIDELVAKKEIDVVIAGVVVECRCYLK